MKLYAIGEVARYNVEQFKLHNTQEVLESKRRIFCHLTSEIKETVKVIKTRDELRIDYTSVYGYVIASATMRDGIEHKLVYIPTSEKDGEMVAFKTDSLKVIVE